MLDFRPPLDSKPLIETMKVAMPFVLRQTGGLTVAPVEGALERFQKVAGQRGMVCPNHSNRIDPLVMFRFAMMVKEDFNYVAAREVFDWEHGLNGWFLQRLGAYSVVRGAADRESFKMTRKVLAEGKKKLVLFPEGEISRQNDTLMSLETGAAQLTFWGVEELTKMSAKNNGQVEPLYLTPVALKYTYATDVRPALKRTLSSLENHLGINNSTTEFYPRLRAISALLLETMEKEYGMKSATDATTNDRIAALRTHILNTVAQQLHITLAPNAKPLESVRILRNAMDDFIYVDEVPKSEYHRKIHDEKSAIVKGFYRDLDRIVNFIVIYEGYFTEQNTQERFADIIERLESEIIGGDPSTKGPRRVLLDVGESINMTERYADYKKEKKAVLNKTMDEVAQQISKMLVNFDNLRSPLLLD